MTDQKNAIPLSSSYLKTLLFDHNGALNQRLNSIHISIIIICSDIKDWKCLFYLKVLLQFKMYSLKPIKIIILMQDTKLDEIVDPVMVAAIDC